MSSIYERMIDRIDDLILENENYYKSMNAQLHDIRVVVEQMKEGESENDDKKLELLLEEKKEEGRRECFELMKKLAAMPSEKLLEYFDSDNVAEIISFLTYEYIERGINQHELEPKSKPEPEFKRGDIVDVTYYCPDDVWRKMTGCIFLGYAGMMAEIVDSNNDRMVLPACSTKISYSVED